MAEYPKSSIMNAPSTGKKYGFELALMCYTWLDLVVDQYIKDVVMTWPSDRKPRILDIGGASGVRAQTFAEFGCQTCVIDICDRAKTIAARNERLGWQAINFIRDNILQVDTRALSNNWSLINMTHVIHWLPWEDTKKLFLKLPELAPANTPLAIDYTPSIFSERGTKVARTNDGNAIFYHHHPDDIVDLLHTLDYEITSRSKNDPAQLFVKIPEARTKHPHL